MIDILLDQAILLFADSRFYSTFKSRILGTLCVCCRTGTLAWKSGEMSRRAKLAEIIGHDNCCASNYGGSCDCGSEARVEQVLALLRQWEAERIRPAIAALEDAKKDLLSIGKEKL